MTRRYRSTPVCFSTLRLVALVLVALAAAPAHAQWPDDSALNLTLADRPAGQAQPKIVPTTDGGFYVSWFGGGGDGFDVYLQRIDAEGNALWAPGGVRVADRNLSSTQDYGLSVDSDGNALLAFGVEDAGGTLQTVANRVSPDGTVLWGAGGVSVSNDAGGTASPRIAGGANGAAIVAWTSSDGDIVVQKIDATGAPMWATGGVALPTPTGFFLIADLHTDAAGNAIVSGSAQLSFSSRRLWAQKLSSADGAPMWGASPVEVFNGSDGALQLGYFPEFVPDGAGGAVFSWYTVSGVSTSIVRVQHVRADGSLAFAQNGVGVTSTAVRQQGPPSAAYDAATGDTYVVWPDEQTVGTVRTFGVSAQRISDAGTRMWGDAGRVLVAQGSEQSSQVRATLAEDGAVFAWVLGSTPSPMRAEASRLDATGAAVWTGGTVAFKTAPTSMSRLQSARSTDGFTAYAWADGENGVALKVQNVNSDGTLGNAGVASEAPVTEVGRLVLGAGAPNPFSTRTTLAYTLPEAAHVRAEVYDATGRRIAVLVDAEQSADPHEIVWDAAGLPGGVYLFRVQAGEQTATTRLVVAR